MSVQSHLNSLKQKHQILKETIRTYAVNLRRDSTKITELKKQKLLLKEKISRLELLEKA